MTGTMLWATIFDILLGMAVIIGFIYEEKVIEFEDRMIYALARVWKRHKRRRWLKKKAAQKAHLRVVRAETNCRSYNKSA